VFKIQKFEGENQMIFVEFFYFEHIVA